MLNDKSTWSLIIANIVTVAMAVIWRWNVYDVIFIYWCQSVIIGIFTFHKLLTFSLENYQGDIDDGNALEFNDLAVTNPKAAKILLAGFFAIHYGLFHLVYLIFIVTLSSSTESPLDLTAGLLAVLIFIANHFYSYYLHKNEGLTGHDVSAARLVSENTIENTFTKPYVRIFPIHLTIMAGAFLSHLLGDGMFGSTLVLLIFMGLKTFMDVMAHLKKHQLWSFKDSRAG